VHRSHKGGVLVTASGLPTVETRVNAPGPKKPFIEYRSDEETDVKAESNSVVSSTNFFFCGFDKVDVDKVDVEDEVRIVAATRPTASELTNHFEYNTAGNVVCAPVLFGGRKNGATVAVLSTRTRT